MLSRFYYLSHDDNEYSHLDQVTEACKGGARFIQLRMKAAGFPEWLRTAQQAVEIANRFDAQLIVNDNVRVAKESGADGVHLGAYDMDPIRARQILGEGALIGGTAHSIAEAERLLLQQVDYIGIGPYRFTKSKKNLRETLGISGIRSIMGAVQSSARVVPVYVIGGITRDDVTSILDAGAHGVAVGGGARSGGELAMNVSAFVEVLHRGPLTTLSTELATEV